MAKKKRIMWNYDKVKKFVEGEEGNGCELLSGEYKNNATKMVFRCKCGNRFEVAFGNFVGSNKRQCNTCGRLNQIERSKLSYESVREFIEVESNSGCRLLSEKYQGSASELKLQCKCGNIFKTTWDNFKNPNVLQRRCKSCSLKNRVAKTTKTHNEFVEEIYTLVGNEYIVVGKYKNAKTKVWLKHNDCGNSWRVIPNSFTSGSRCPYCFGNMKKTTEQFKEEVFELVGREYTILGEYVNTHTKVKVTHNECQHEYYVTPASFLNGRRCPKCFGSIKKTTEQFKQDIYDLVEDEYVLLGEYIDYNTKMSIRHNVCGFTYEVSPSKFINGRRCPKCAGKLRKSTKYFKDEVFQLVGDEYHVIGEYIRALSDVRIQHNKCGYAWDVKPSNFLRGTRCPKCNSSKGELKVEEFLTYSNVVYESQYKYDDCKNISPLPFDFALMSSDKRVILIEYDGKQHYEPIDFFGGQEQFEYQRQNDNIKSQYCKDNNIPLLRIPYWDFNNIEQILEEWLHKHDLLQKDKSIT